jgi:hypothetical protein
MSDTMMRKLAAGRCRRGRAADGWLYRAAFSWSALIAVDDLRGTLRPSDG